MNVKFIQELHAKIVLGQATSEENVPTDKVEAGEKILGTIDDPVARSLWSLCVRIEDYCEDYIASITPKNAEEANAIETKFVEHAAHLHVMMRACQAVSDDFWARVYERFPEICDENVEGSVREGFQVVVWKSKRPQGFPRVSVVEVRFEDPKAKSPAAPKAPESTAEPQAEAAASAS